MYHELKKFFRYLNLVREDIRDELDLLGVSNHFPRICDFGCGSGLTTFALALEIGNADCIGIDLFGSEADLFELHRHIREIRHICQDNQSTERLINDDLCRLHQEGRLPKFTKGNIVLNQGMPDHFDLAYCKKLLINFRDKQYPNSPSGKVALSMALNNIAGSLSPEGKLCVIEYESGFELEKCFEESRFSVLKRTQLQRREIRSRGRTNMVSRFTLYLCQKQE